ncbi:hypothetical protein N9L68_06890, partial [bacterium]|nr:hypothetical protein [bacterium]
GQLHKRHNKRVRHSQRVRFDACLGDGHVDELWHADGLKAWRIISTPIVICLFYVCRPDLLAGGQAEEPNAPCFPSERVLRPWTRQRVVHRRCASAAARVVLTYSIRHQLTNVP